MSGESRQLEITFKSGATVSVDVDSFTIRKNDHGETTAIEWASTLGSGKRRLLRLELNEIVAVVEVQP